MCMEVIAKLLNTSAVLANMIAHAVQHWWLIGFLHQSYYRTAHSMIGCRYYLYGMCSHAANGQQHV